jgi:hypothetical protein
MNPHAQGDPNGFGKGPSVSRKPSGNTEGFFMRRSVVGSCCPIHPVRMPGLVRCGSLSLEQSDTSARWATLPGVAFPLRDGIG